MTYLSFLDFANIRDTRLVRRHLNLPGYLNLMMAVVCAFVSVYGGLWLSFAAGVLRDRRFLLVNSG